MAVAGRHHQVDFVDLAGEGAFATFHVGHQNGVFHTGYTLDAVHHCFGVAQVGNCLGRGEGGDLDLRQAGLRQAIDQGDLVLAGDELGFDLETVTGGDFLDIQTFIHALFL
ncbi:hypothetical protein D9M68_961930 [compost metagenome]